MERKEILGFDTHSALLSRIALAEPHALDQLVNAIVQALLLCVKVAVSAVVERPSLGCTGPFARGFHAPTVPQIAHI